MAISLQEYRNKVAALRDKLAAKALDVVIYPAALSLLGTIKNRINDGGNSKGGKIGQYSTKPAYFRKDQFVKRSAFKPIGKNGFKGERVVSEREYRVEERTLKSGKLQQRLVSEQNYRIEKRNLQSMYLAGGYKELRAIQGRRTDVVNFNYRGSLLLSFGIGKSGQTVLIGFKNEKEALKRAGLEKRFGKVFTATDAELKEYNKEVTEESRELINTLLR